MELFKTPLSICYIKRLKLYLFSIGTIVVLTTYTQAILSLSFVHLIIAEMFIISVKEILFIS